VAVPPGPPERGGGRDGRAWRPDRRHGVGVTRDRGSRSRRSRGVVGVVGLAAESSSGGGSGRRRGVGSCSCRARIRRGRVVVVRSAGCRERARSWSMARERPGPSDRTGVWGASRGVVAVAVVGFVVAAWGRWQWSPCQPTSVVFRRSRGPGTGRAATWGTWRTGITVAGARRRRPRCDGRSRRGCWTSATAAGTLGWVQVAGAGGVIGPRRTRRR